MPEIASPSIATGASERYRANRDLHRNPPRDSFGTYLQLRAVVRGFEEVLEGFLGRHDLTIGEFCALRLLVDDGPKSLSLVGSWVSISNSGTTKMVDRLEGRGLGARGRDAADRRVVRVEPTVDGVELVQRVFPEHLGNIDALMGSLDAVQTEQLYDLLSLLRAGIDGQLLDRASTVDTADGA